MHKKTWFFTTLKYLNINFFYCILCYWLIACQIDQILTSSKINLVKLKITFNVYIFLNYIDYYVSYKICHQKLTNFNNHKYNVGTFPT